MRMIFAVLLLMFLCDFVVSSCFSVEIGFVLLEYSSALSFQYFDTGRVANGAHQCDLQAQQTLTDSLFRLSVQVVASADGR